MVDAFAIGVVTVLVQVDDKDQMQAYPDNSSIFTKSEQKLAIIYN